MFHLLGDVGQNLADFDARSRGIHFLELAPILVAWLEVPEIKVARPAAHPKDDQALVFLLQRFLGSVQPLQKAHTRKEEG